MCRRSDQESDCVSTTSVTTWLQAHPLNPTEYESADWVATSPKRRKLQQIHTTELSPSKRLRLKEITVNQMSEPGRESSLSIRREPKRKRLSGREYSESPITDGAPSQTLPSTPYQRQSHSRTTLLDEDQTPRPLATGAEATHTTTHFGNAVWDRRSDLSSGVSTSIGTRSSSPTKRLGDLQLSDLRVELKQFGTSGYSPPTAAETLLQDVRRLGKGFGVIPVGLREQMRAPKDDDPVEDFNFEKPKANPDKDDVFTSPDLHFLWHDLSVVHDAARDCQNEASSEPEWNSEVHSRILRLALQSSRATSGVWYRNVTVDRIHDTNLLPTIPGTAKRLSGKMQSKMVDFVLMLEPDAKMHDDIVGVLNERPNITDRSSVNHASPEGIRFKPVAVSIETKRAAIEEDAANLQLAVWVSAHFAKLCQLVSPLNQPPSIAHDLPILPLIIVQGHVWKLLIAYSAPSSSSSTATNKLSPSSVIILRDVTLGTTSSILGCLTVIASLRRLMRWASKDFQKWWRELLIHDEVT